MIAETKRLVVENEEAVSGSISLCNDRREEVGGLGIDGEGLDLEDDLDDTVEDGDGEVGQGQSGGADSRPLLKRSLVR